MPPKQLPKHYTGNKNVVVVVFFYTLPNDSQVVERRNDSNQEDKIYKWPSFSTSFIPSFSKEDNRDTKGKNKGEGREKRGGNNIYIRIVSQADWVSTLPSKRIKRGRKCGTLTPDGQNVCHTPYFVSILYFSAQQQVKRKVQISKKKKIPFFKHQNGYGERCTRRAPIFKHSYKQ